MRLVTFDAGQGPRAGVLSDGTVVEAADSVRKLLALSPDSVHASGAEFPVDAVRLLPPVPDPEKIICLGLNYRDHAAEANLDIPAAPMFFTKFASSLVGHGDPVVVPPAAAAMLDYEAELAFVIGREGRHIPEERALDHVAGVMPLNDVTARDLQWSNFLWTRGKAIDTFAPCGPALVLMDEVEDVQSLRVLARVNGETLQDGTTADQIFGVAETVAFLSETMTLKPGDIVATGTPAGVGMLRQPQRFLSEGDVVEIEIEGIGTLSNPIESERR